MFKSLIFVISLFLLFSSCKSDNKKSLGSKKIVGILAGGHFYDKGYNQSAREGGIKLRDEFGIKLLTKSLRPYPIVGQRFLTADEAMLEDAYEFLKGGMKLFWLIGSQFSDLLIKLSYEQTDINYGIIDACYYRNVRVPKNSLVFKFKNEEASFLAGYIAAKMNRKNKIGLLLGPVSVHLNDFKFGFKSGIFYANPKVRVITKSAYSFYDKDRGKEMAKFMYEDDKVGVILSLAGITSFGVFDAAKELGAEYYVIGMDRDQSYIAPQNVITSIVKYVDKVIYSTSADYVKNGVFNGGIVVKQGLKEGVMSVIKDSNILSEELINEIVNLENKIINGEIIVPDSEYEFDLFKSTKLLN